MNTYKRYAIVICPGTVENHNYIPAEYKIVESQICPLGNENCSFHNANITHCVRGGTNGINKICLCKPFSRLRPADIVYFSDAIRQMGGNDMLRKIMLQLSNNERHR